MAALRVIGRLSAFFRPASAAGGGRSAQAAAALKSSGDAFLADGEHAAAARCYEEALALQPDDANLHLNLGFLAMERQDHVHAAACLARAIELDPASADASYLMGMLLRERGERAGAIGRLSEAIRLKPDMLVAYAPLATLLIQEEEHRRAKAVLQGAIDAGVRDADLYFLLGNLTLLEKQYVQAVACYQEVLRLQPTHLPACLQAGNALVQERQFAPALQYYDRLLAADPVNADALGNRGVALEALGRHDDAMASYSRAIELRPAAADMHFNLGNVLARLGRDAEAVDRFDQAVRLMPQHAEALCNRGNALRMLGRYAEAVQSYDGAIAIRPDFVEAHSNRGAALGELDRHPDALASYARALALDPEHAWTHFNEGISRLLHGELRAGWEKYEWRWKTAALKDDARRFPQPQWTGSAALEGKTIFLHAEQGLGDTIQFCRYASHVAKKGATVLLAVQPSLVQLLSTLAGVHRIVASGTTLPPFDLHCPLMSLPRAFDTDLATIPATVPYLFADPVRSTAWAARLGPKRAPRVGLLWSGSTVHKNDRNRSVPLSLLEPLLAQPCEFFSLQKEVRPADAQLLAQLSNRGQLVSCADDLADFADTAAMIAGMDLVISVDTSVAHLAGALGKPLWLLLPFNPDWRWLRDGDATPWYPTARLFRQREQDGWQAVVDAVGAALAQWQAQP
jgi:tetratricopeptide (TPR) repeat protein